jgi:periplasmic protein TonB
LVHAAVLSIPLSLLPTAKQMDSRIDIALVTDNTPLAQAKQEETKRVLPKKVVRPVPKTPDAPTQVRQDEVKPPQPDPRIEEKPATPPGSAPRDGQFLVRAGSKGDGETGVALPLSAGTGAGFGDGTGKSRGAGGSGTGPGSAPGSGSGPLDAEFGRPDGPQFQYRAIPEYPFAARRLGKEGRVLLLLHIDEHGNLSKVQVIDGSGELFVEAAVTAVKRSRFLPAKKNGVPVPARATLPIRFSLSR